VKTSVKLIFKPYPKQRANWLEAFLQARRLERLWCGYEMVALASFLMHTGLAFRDKRITIYVGADIQTHSGDSGHAMQITYNSFGYSDSDDELMRTLLHELAHRLVMGNGIRSKQEEYTYLRNLLAHKRIYLFLYDVEADVLGEEVASEDVASTLQWSKRAFGNAWDWALAKTYDERQQAIRRMIRRGNPRVATLVQ